MQIEDIRVGHVLKAAVAVTFAGFIWLMMTTGMAVWWGMLIAKAMHETFSSVGLPVGIVSLLTLFVVTVPPMVIAGGFAMAAWQEFYPSKK